MKLTSREQREDVDIKDENEKVSIPGKNGGVPEGGCKVVYH